VCCWCEQRGHPSLLRHALLQQQQRCLYVCCDSQHTKLQYSLDQGVLLPAGAARCCRGTHTEVADTGWRAGPHGVHRATVKVSFQ
jgi:hypothetical protein